MKYTFFIFFILYSLNSYTQDLIPLADGNTWVYEKTDRAGNTMKKTTNKATTFKQVGNKQWFHLTEFGSSFVVRNDKNGQWEGDSVIIASEKGISEEVLMFRNPTKEVQNYTVYEIVHVEVANKASKITTKAGKFKAYKYQIISGESIITYYLCPKVGTISYTYKEGTSYEHYELISYTLK